MKKLAPDEVAKMTLQERCARILDEFDEWLAVRRLQLELKYEDLPLLNDAFRTYFAGMRTMSGAGASKEAPCTKKVIGRVEPSPCGNDVAESSLNDVAESSLNDVAESSINDVAEPSINVGSTDLSATLTDLSAVVAIIVRIGGYLRTEDQLALGLAKARLSVLRADHRHGSSDVGVKLCGETPIPRPRDSAGKLDGDASVPRYGVPQTGEDPAVTLRRLRQRLYVIEPVYRATVALHRNGAKETREGLDRVELSVCRALDTESRIANGWSICDLDLDREVPL